MEKRDACTERGSDSSESEQERVREGGEAVNNYAVRFTYFAEWGITVLESIRVFPISVHRHAQAQYTVTCMSLCPCTGSGYDQEAELLLG